MNRLFFTGLFMWITCSVQAQAWKNCYDSALLIWNEDWKKTISLLHQAEQFASLDASPSDKDHLTILYDLGIAYWEQGDHTHAALYFNRSRKIEPTFPSHPHADDVFSSFTGLAQLYAQQGATQKAKAFYSFILFNGHVPSDPITYYTAAQQYVSLYEKANALDSALQLWDYLTSQYPLQGKHDLTLYTNWQLTCIRLNRKLHLYTVAEQKLSDLKEFIQQYPRAALSTTPYVDLLIEAGSLYLQTGKPSVAKKSLQEAKRLVRKQRPSYTPENWQRLAVLYEVEKKYKKALRYNKKLTNPINAVTPCNLSCLAIHHKIADLYLATRKYTLAVAQYEDLLTAYRHFVPEHDERFVGLLNNLSEAYCACREYHTAYVYLRWAAEVMDVKTIKRDLAARVFTNLATVYTWKGDHPAAKNYQDQAALLGMR